MTTILYGVRRRALWLLLLLLSLVTAANAFVFHPCASHTSSPQYARSTLPRPGVCTTTLQAEPSLFWTNPFANFPWIIKSKRQWESKKVVLERARIGREQGTTALTVPANMLNATPESEWDPNRKEDLAYDRYLKWTLKKRLKHAPAFDKDKIIDEFTAPPKKPMYIPEVATTETSPLAKLLRPIDPNTGAPTNPDGVPPGMNAEGAPTKDADGKHEGTEQEADEAKGWKKYVSKPTRQELNSNARFWAIISLPAVLIPQTIGTLNTCTWLLAAGQIATKITSPDGLRQLDGGLAASLAQLKSAAIGGVVTAVAYIVSSIFLPLFAHAHHKAIFGCLVRHFFYFLGTSYLRPGPPIKL